MLVEASIDFLFLESVIILASEVFIIGVLFCGTVYHSLLLRPLACHHLRNFILIFKCFC